MRPPVSYHRRVFFCPLTGPRCRFKRVNLAAPWPALYSSNIRDRQPWPVGTGHRIRVTASGSPVTGPPIGQSGPLAPVTGNRTGNRAAGTKARVSRPVARYRVPSGIGSKTAEIRQKSAIFAPPPTPWLTLARAMFLANIYVKNDMGC